MRIQRPGSTPRSNLMPMISSKGWNRPAGIPRKVSRMSETQAPGPPIQFATGPAALVFIDGSV